MPAVPPRRAGHDLSQRRLGVPGHAPADLTFAIPCHDGERYLRPLLESLLAQTAVGCRLLLVDDASRDASIALAREIAGDRVEIVRNECAVGIPANWSRCATLVQSEYFCLAHQDDVYAPRFAETLVAALATAPDAAVAHCRAGAIDAEGLPLRSMRERYKERYWRDLPRIESPGAGYRRLFQGNYICCPSIVYRRSAFSAVGDFDGQYRFAPDWEWLLRAHAKGWSFVAVPDVLVSYRRHPTQASLAEARSARRYREEHTLLAHARVVGADRGLLRADAQSTAMRDNLLFDAFCDLEARDYRRARHKLDLLLDIDPAARRSWPARALAAVARLGWPGRKATALALGTWIAWHARA